MVGTARIGWNGCETDLVVDHHMNGATGGVPLQI